MCDENSGSPFLAKYASGVHEAVEPRQPRAHAVVGVQDDGHAVQLGDLTRVERTRNGASDARSVIVVVRRLAGHELATTARELDDHRTTVLGSRLQARVDRARGDHVDSRDGVLVLLGMLQQVPESLAGDDTAALD